MTDQKTDLLPCPFCGSDMEDRNGVLVHPSGVTRDDACVLSGLGFPVVHTIWGTNEIERWNRRADLAPRVKPLSFGRAEKSGMNIQADCAFGRYYIAARPDGVWLWWRPASGPAHHGSAKSEDEAIQQCQADYERRILSAIDMAPIHPAREAAEDLLEALVDMTNFYVELVNSGDCGCMDDAETEIEVRASRAAIAKAKGETQC